jgi:hypothetical protein
VSRIRRDIEIRHRRECVNRIHRPRVAALRDPSFGKETIVKNGERRAKTHRGWSIVALAAAALSACSGGGGSNGNAANPNPSTPTGNCADCGTLLVGLTDADGDFVSYAVDVLSVTLKRSNGATVETLPAKTRIDFAQLTDLADLLSVSTVAPGDFVGGKIRIDYSNAEVAVEKAGQTVLAKVVDQSGQPLGIVDLDVDLSNRDRLVITRGRAAFLSLDFDLAASNDVDLSKTPVVVTARPFVVAEIQPVDQKDLRVRGPLVVVDNNSSSYTVDVRPWFRREGEFGRVTVHTAADTSFEIGGTAYMGAAGLAALAQQPAGTPTLAFGTLAVQGHDFTAEVVQAGDSVGGPRMDAVHGSVVSRVGNQLTVKGAFAVHRDDQQGNAAAPGDDNPDHAHFVRTVIVTIGPDTKVLKVGAMQVLDASAISVGQSIVAFGKFDDPQPVPMADTTTTTPATFDATAGRVRLEVTQVRGAVVSAAAGQLNLKLGEIGRLGVEMFNFAGTGTTASTDADPNNYEIATSSLPLATLGAGEAAKVLGFVRPFGSAPADFEGRTVIDRADLPTVLAIGWGTSGTAAPFLSSGNAGLVLDLHNAAIGDRHTLSIGMRTIDLLGLAASPIIVGADGRATYGLWEAGHVELFTSFADFVAALNARLAGGEKVQGLMAYGSFDAGTSTFTANHIAVHLVTN